MAKKKVENQPALLKIELTPSGALVVAHVSTPKEKAKRSPRKKVDVPPVIETPRLTLPSFSLPHTYTPAEGKNAWGQDFPQVGNWVIRDQKMDCDNVGQILHIGNPPVLPMHIRQAYEKTGRSIYGETMVSIRLLNGSQAGIRMIELGVITEDMAFQVRKYFQV